MKRHSGLFFRLSIAFGVWLILMTASPALAQVKHKILLINSYNYTLEWTRSLTQGVVYGFEQSPDITLWVEFLDSKNHGSPTYYAQLFDNLRTKYSDEKFDVIMTSDDNAINFLLEHRDALFPGVPIVFCGVNNYDLLSDPRFGNMTGVFEKVDIEGTLHIALQLMPETKTVYVINDQTTTGQINHEKVLKIMPRFKEEVDIVFLENLTSHQLSDALENLPDESVVLLLSFNEDANGTVYTYSESLQLIHGVSSRPIFGLWDFYLNKGIVGGNLTSGEYQGRAAAALVLRVLNGEKASDIQPIGESANRFMFDYDELRRFHLSVNQLPHGAVVINKPRTFWEAYKIQVLGVGGVVLFLLVVILLLLNNMRIKRHANQELEALNGYQEQLIEDRTQELMQRTRDLEMANYELKQLDALKTAVMNTVSHDLRTPLTSVLGFCKIISRDFERYFLPLSLSDCGLEKKGKRIESNLAIINDEGERLTRLINDFLDLSKIESGHISWNDIPFDPAVVLRQAEKMFSGYFVSEDVTFSMQIPPTLPFVHADPDRFLQVLINLVGNAAKFTEKGSVRVESFIGEGSVQVSVLDTGIGIPEEKMDQVFKTFYQIEDRVGVSGIRGSGMGLAICKRIVEHYNGRIWATDNAGQGAAFHFVIPVVD